MSGDLQVGNLFLKIINSLLDRERCSAEKENAIFFLRGNPYVSAYRNVR